MAVTESVPGAPELPGGAVQTVGVPGADPGAHQAVPRRQAARAPVARTRAPTLPLVLVLARARAPARGPTIEAADGRRYVGCPAGAGCVVLGHHPVVLEALRGVLDPGAPFPALDLATPVEDALTAKLPDTLPRGPRDRARTRFRGPARTDAVQGAVELVCTAPGTPTAPGPRGYGRSGRRSPATTAAVDHTVRTLPAPCRT